MEGIESLAVFEEKVALTPRDLANPKINIEKAVQGKLSEKIEAKCSVHGWVVPNTVKVLSRSMGYVEKGRFTGDIVFHVQAQASVLNPASSSRLICEVTGNNMMGMYVTYRTMKKEVDRKTKAVSNVTVDAIKVILPRDLHIGDEAFSKIQIGERVKVEIKKSRFQVNDKFILSVGVFEGKVGSEYVPPAVTEEENVVEEEAGPGAIAAQRVKEFEEKEAEREEAKRQEFVIENEVEGAAPGTGEPIYFNAAKIDTNKELDNRFPAPFTLDGKTWPTVEHYYQASKFPTLPEFQEQIRLMPSATAAMKAGKTKDPSKPIRADWKEQREPSMRMAIFAKFDQNPALKEKIVATYPSPLIFADANDSFWGYGRTKMGQNKLGSLLMNYRSMHTGME
jgi:ribA/ribD-fused uncharacterized protein